MFGSIGGGEIIFLFILALIIFGPRRLPEIGRTLGKAMADFKRATNDFKSNLEREVQLDALKEAGRGLETLPPPSVLARGALDPVVAPATVTPAADAPASEAAPLSSPPVAATAASGDATGVTSPAPNGRTPPPASTDGGNDSIH